MPLPAQRSFHQRIPWRWIGPSAFGLLLLAASPLVFVRFVAQATRDLRFADPRQVPAHPVAIVFGAGVRPNGALSPMLAARVQAAVELYRLGHVQKILMTGDNSQVDYDEVTAMQRDAVASGVPAAAIRLDHAGFSTYESCYRAREIFGVRSAILITQGYHLPRAVYTCRQLGLDVVGLETNDRGLYPEAVIRYYEFREALATSKALWDVHLWHPVPTFLGQYEGME